MQGCMQLLALRSLRTIFSAARFASRSCQIRISPVYCDHKRLKAFHFRALLPVSWTPYSFTAMRDGLQSIAKRTHYSTFALLLFVIVSHASPGRRPPRTLHISPEEEPTSTRLFAPPENGESEQGEAFCVVHRGACDALHRFVSSPVPIVVCSCSLRSSSTAPFPSTARTSTQPTTIRPTSLWASTK